LEKNCDIAKIIHRAFQCPFTISNSSAFPVQIESLETLDPFFDALSYAKPLRTFAGNARSLF